METTERLRRKTWPHNPNMVKPSVYRVPIPVEGIVWQEMADWLADYSLTIRDCFICESHRSGEDVALFGFDDTVLAVHFKLRFR
jgi:hypothetical protein